MADPKNDDKVDPNEIVVAGGVKEDGNIDDNNVYIENNNRYDNNDKSSAESFTAKFALAIAIVHKLF